MLGRLGIAATKDHLVTFKTIGQKILRPEKRVSSENMSMRYMVAMKMVLSSR